ncbi:MAG: hypothetical protein PHI39_00795, partial [Kiritimatiellae bacterium]|nr:hypothetical protein [Kiritimatiellia bacterium]
MGRLVAGILFLPLVLCALAGPGDGISLSSWVFSPYLELNATYDSNVYKDYEDEIDDVFIEPELGLR